MIQYLIFITFKETHLLQLKPDFRSDSIKNHPYSSVNKNEQFKKQETKIELEAAH